MQAASVLFSEMRTAFRFIEPTQANFGSFGHEIRNLLILACTEVESSWKSVLRANDPTGKFARRLSTNDYVRLLAPLRLADWEVSIPSHPGIPSIKPFAGWTQNSPTDSLDWYTAYNAVKHDRENAFQDATLIRMVTAMAGVFVLVTAQFGTWTTQGEDVDDPQIFPHLLPNTFLIVGGPPRFSDDELYVRRQVGGAPAWTGRPYPF